MRITPYTPLHNPYTTLLPLHPLHPSTSPHLNAQTLTEPHPDLCAQYKVDYIDGGVTSLSSTTFTKCAEAMLANAAADIYVFGKDSFCLFYSCNRIVYLLFI